MKFSFQLVFLGCLFSTVTLSPIKGRRDSLIPSPNRFLRVKTAVRTTADHHQSTNRGSYQDPTAPVAHFDSKQTHQAEGSFKDPGILTQDENTYVHSQVSQQDLSQVSDIDQQVTQNDQQVFVTENTPSQVPSSAVTHTETPNSSNFGVRFQKTGQSSESSRCYLKGGCSTINFRPDDKIPEHVASAGSNFGVTDVQSITVSPFNQQEEYQLSKNDAFDTAQNSQDANTNNEFVPSQPDFRGQVSVQDVSDSSKDPIQSFQDNQYEIPQEFAGGKNQLIDEQVEGIVHPDFDSHTQFISQKDSTDYNNEQQLGHNIPTQEQSFFDVSGEQKNVLSSGFPDEQSFGNVAPNYEQNNQRGISQFAEHSTGQESPESFNTQTQTHSFHDQQIPEQFGASDVEGGSYKEHDDGQYRHYANPIEGLRYNVPGNPGEDYPIFYKVPETSFNCQQQPFSGGIFGDTEASCQVFHVCKQNGGQASFLCPNGTVFNQQYFVCDWWYNYKCSDTPSFYNLNADLYWDLESFTPSQVLNVPSSGDEQSFTTIQGGLTGSLGSASSSRDNIPTHDEVQRQNQAIKSTIAIDNTAIANRNRNVIEQRLDNHMFSQENTAVQNAGNIFQEDQQDFYEQQKQDYPSSFASGGSQPATVTPVNNNFQNIPGSPIFPTNDNQQKKNNFHPASSDTGANRQPETDAGTRYPDQNGYGPQFIDVFQTEDQTTPSTLVDSQRFHDSIQSVQERPHVDDISIPFGNINPSSIVDDRIQQDQIDYEQKDKHIIPFDNNQQTSQRQRPVTNDIHNQQKQEAQQQDISSLFEENVPNSFESDAQTDNQNADYDYNSQISTVNSQDSVGRQPSDNQNLQRDIQVQEHISSSFEESRPSSFQDTNGGNEEVQNQNIFTQQQTDTSFKPDVNDGRESSSNHGNNQEYPDVHDEYKPSSFNDQTTFTSDRGQGMQDIQSHMSSSDENIPNQFGSSGHDLGIDTLQQNQEDVSFQARDQTSLEEKGIRGSNFKDNSKVQQDSTFGSSNEHNRNVFRQVDNRVSFGSNSFVNNPNQQISTGNRNNLNINSKQFLQQEHISSSLGQSSFSNFDNKVQTNQQGDNLSQNNQGFVNIEARRPNDFDSRDNVGYPIHENQNFQQEKVSPFDGTLDVLNPNTKEISNVLVSEQKQNIPPFPSNEQTSHGSEIGGQNFGIRTGQQEEQSVVHQEDISGLFLGENPSTHVANENHPRNLQQEHINDQNRKSTFGINTPQTIENDNKVAIQNVLVNHGQQEHISSFSDNDQRHKFQVGNNGNQFSQGEIVNNPDKSLVLNNNQPNNFQDSGYRSIQNIHPGQGNNFNVHNNFRQDNNNNGWQHVQQQRQSVSFDTHSHGNVGSHQNANEAFEMRLNNFQPSNIHTMSRGGLQDRNNQQQPMSFRHYGQNPGNNVNGPQQQTPGLYAANQGQDSAHFTGNTPSNRNFFVTNGHQVRDENPHQINNNQFSDDRRPVNQIQEQPRQFIQQDVYNQDQSNSNSLALNRNPEATATHNQQNDRVPIINRPSNENINSGVKNYESSQNYRERKSIDFAEQLNGAISPRGAPTLFINTGDAVSYNQQGPQSAAVSYNGWRPIVNH